VDNVGFGGILIWRFVGLVDLVVLVDLMNEENEEGKDDGGCVCLDKGGGGGGRMD